MPVRGHFLSKRTTERKFQSTSPILGGFVISNFQVLYFRNSMRQKTGSSFDPDPDSIGFPQFLYNTVIHSITLLIYVNSR
jgi:hypothetical protein